MAMRHVLTELSDAYERQSGQPVAIVAAGGVDAARRVEDGEAFDFVVLAANAIEKLAAGGRVDPESRTDLARSPVAIAVAAGATRP
jgi:ABC-type molybdate transport system, periplasmic component